MPDYHSRPPELLPLSLISGVRFVLAVTIVIMEYDPHNVAGI
ncbi:MAG TPA: hypothetical protein VGJ92_13280 [Methanocella sp.]